MIRSSSGVLFLSVVVLMSVGAVGVQAQHATNAKRGNEAEFGPVMRAYLGYLRNEQEVVDDRISRREITSDYYRRNSNRIRALRQIAVRLVTKSGNDYVPELEAVTADELRILFEDPPSLRTLRVNEVVRNTFRYLGTVQTGEAFYVFARLDPYEQAALMEGKGATNSEAIPNTAPPSAAKGQKVGQPTTRQRRATPQ